VTTDPSATTDKANASESKSATEQKTGSATRPPRPVKKGAEPMTRMCALTRKQGAADKLVRFVLSPDSEVTPDLKRRLPGRGVWLSTRRSVIAEAVKRKLFARSFRQQAKADAALPELVESLLKKEALNALSLANKAGLVITGYEKLREAIGNERIRSLLHALDAADNGADRLDRMISHQGNAQVRNEDEGEGAKASSCASPVLPRLFTADELSLALGRGNVVHVGMKQGQAAKRFEQALLRLVAYQTEDDDNDKNRQTDATETNQTEKGVALSNG